MGIRNAFFELNRVLLDEMREHQKNLAQLKAFNQYLSQKYAEADIFEHCKK